MYEVIEKENVKIKDMIYEINGIQVMLDSDLALLYGTETKRINEAVRRNEEKFPKKYSWILTNEESDIFLVANCDQKVETRGGRYKNPRVFTDFRNNFFHDRFFIIDRNDIYLSGSSFNNAGNKTFMIIKIEKESVKNTILKDIDKIINK